MILPALSIQQPWADRIRNREKSIETRTWTTRYRGPLVICSSKQPRGQGVTSKALCIRFLMECRPMTHRDEAAACCEVYERAQAWVFHQYKIIDLSWFDVRGRLGIFPLLVPDGSFYGPEERDRARQWLEWSQSRGLLRMIKEFRLQEQR